MEERKILCKAYFNFSKKVMPWTKRRMKSEYFRLRNIAVKELNKYFEKWNEEFGIPNPKENDPLKEYGGSEYCNFIRKKERLILSRINSKEAKRGVFLDADEIGDLVAINWNKCVLTVNIEFIKELED